MAYDVTWDINYEVEPTSETDLTAQCRSFGMQWKDYLISQGWAMHESCDSAAVGGAGVDKWDSLTDIVAATGAHSWAVLKSPEGFVVGADGSSTGDQSRIWLNIDYRYANYYQMHISAHRVAPSGGTTTAAPTASGSLLSGSQQFNRSSLNTTAKFHFASTSTGGVLAMITYNGAGYVPFCCFLWPCINLTEVLSTTFDYPYGFAFYTSWTDSGKGVFQRANVGLSSTGVRCFGFDGTACVGVMNALSTDVEWIGSSWGTTGDFNGEHTPSSVWFSCESSGKYGVVGKMPDMRGSGIPTPQGVVDASPPTMIHLGDLWIPTDTLITL